MRVVAGEARGRRLEAPKGREVRPTTDRVRESVFNALGSLDVVEGARVLDLFAGTGALGIEALSRGAARCTFVERDASAMRVLRRNLEATGTGDRAEVVAGDAEDAVARAVARGDRYDLALLDPPYAYAGWDDLLRALPAPIAVIETGRDLAPPAPWQVVRHKWYGSTLVLIARVEPAGGGPDA